jgi:hypothetical protein
LHHASIEADAVLDAVKSASGDSRADDADYHSGFSIALRYVGRSIANRAADAPDHPTGMLGFPSGGHGHALHLAGRKADEGPLDRNYDVTSRADRVQIKNER